MSPSCSAAMPRRYITAIRTWNSFPWTRRLAASEKKGGRNKAVIAQPELQEAIEEAVATRTAGSPVDDAASGRWTNRRRLAEIVSEVVAQGFSAYPRCGTFSPNNWKVWGRAAVKDEAACNFPRAATRSFGTSPSVQWV